MRKYLILAMAFLFLQGLLPAQEFAGTWKASFKGAVFCTLKIEAGSEISGTLNPGRITVNDDGDLTEAEPAPSDAAGPILNAEIDGDQLSFEWKESADDDAVKLEVKLTGENDAEMRFVGRDNIKPIHLHRSR